AVNHRNAPRQPDAEAEPPQHSRDRPLRRAERHHRLIRVSPLSTRWAAATGSTIVRSTAATVAAGERENGHERRLWNDGAGPLRVECVADRGSPSRRPAERALVSAAGRAPSDAARLRRLHENRRPDRPRLPDDAGTASSPRLRAQAAGNAAGV